MDQLLGAFTNRYLDTLDDEDLGESVKLFEIDDSNLYNYYNGLNTGMNLKIIRLISYLKILNVNLLAEDWDRTRKGCLVQTGAFSLSHLRFERCIIKINSTIK